MVCLKLTAYTVWWVKFWIFSLVHIYSISHMCQIIDILCSPGYIMASVVHMLHCGPRVLLIFTTVKISHGLEGNIIKCHWYRFYHWIIVKGSSRINCNVTIVLWLQTCGHEKWRTWRDLHTGIQTWTKGRFFAPSCQSGQPNIYTSVYHTLQQWRALTLML